MRVKSVDLTGFKRFHKLTIRDLPLTAKLVVLTGPNGSGKSSLFDAFATWSNNHHGWGSHWDPTYHFKCGHSPLAPSDCVNIELDRPVPDAPDERKKLFYIRSAHRHEADFSVSQFKRQPEPLDDNRRVKRLADLDALVSANYARLVNATIAEVYSPANDSVPTGVLRERLFGQVRAAMGRVFDDLKVGGLGNPMEGGSFLFDKGASREFPYKNVSGGEKAAFDLLLDFVLKREVFDDTVFCIDEPELHMHTRTQGRLLGELFTLVPERSQLWVSTHSIGMMRKACQLAQEHPDHVTFLDFGDKAFDADVEITPTRPSREYWKKLLAIAMDDLAGLVAPGRVVLCEGTPPAAGSGRSSGRAEFDAACLRAIFAPHLPDTDFMSVGNSTDVQSDRLGAGRAISTIVGGTEVIRVVDRDDLSGPEVAERRAAGVRVLSVRHLESYLYDDEILTRLCHEVQQPDSAAEALQAKHQAIEDSVARGNPSDDIKSAAGTIYTRLKQLLDLTQRGNNPDAFARDTLAPLVTPDTGVYRRLHADLFG